MNKQMKSFKMKHVKCIIFGLVILALAFTVVPAKADTTGEGTAANPWVVESWEDFTELLGTDDFYENGGYIKLGDDLYGEGENGDFDFPVGVDITLDLAGHSFECGFICVGDEGEETTDFSIVSSVEGAEFNPYGIYINGNLSISDCNADIKTNIIGTRGVLLIDNAYVTCANQEVDTALEWRGTEIMLTNGSTMDLNGTVLAVNYDVEMELGNGCLIDKISKIDVLKTDNPENYINVFETYVNHDEYKLAAEDGFIVFKKDGKTVSTGALKGEPVIVKKELTEDINVEFDDLVYDGDDKSDSIKVSVGDETLTKDEDYTVIFKKQVTDEMISDVSSCVDAGDYLAVITGNGAYTGEVKKAFKIAKAVPKYSNPTEILDGTQTKSDLDKELGKPIGVIGEEIEGNWVWGLMQDVYWDYINYDVKFVPKSSNYCEVKAVVSVSKYGKEQMESMNGFDYKYYMAKDGTTSAKVTQGAITWLKEDNGGESRWYGFDNSNDVFEDGSVSSVKWVAPKEKLWAENYQKMDDEYKKAVQDDKLFIFLVGVEKPDGTQYDSLEKPVKLYVELEDDWDIEGIHAVFLGDGNDESVGLEIQDKEINGVTKRFAELKLEHFSPYAIYVGSKDSASETKAKTTEALVSESDTAGTKGKSPKTKDESMVELCTFLALLSFGIMIYTGAESKKRSKVK